AAGGAGANGGRSPFLQPVVADRGAAFHARPEDEVANRQRRILRRDGEPRLALFLRQHLGDQRAAVEVWLEDLRVNEELGPQDLLVHAAERVLAAGPLPYP